MTDKIVSSPQWSHKDLCGPNKHGFWEKHNWTPPGTVVECDECGRSWVGCDVSEYGLMVTIWRREGMVARWVRKHLR